MSNWTCVLIYLLVVNQRLLKFRLMGCVEFVCKVYMFQLSYQ